MAHDIDIELSRDETLGLVDYGDLGYLAQTITEFAAEHDLQTLTIDVVAADERA